MTTEVVPVASTCFPGPGSHDGKPLAEYELLLPGRCLRRRTRHGHLPKQAAQ